jgi:hypothetical protein
MNMNCLEFRREKLADPRRLSREALAHMGDCAACRGFAIEVNENEERIATALEVPVPEGLPSASSCAARPARAAASPRACGRSPPPWC